MTKHDCIRPLSLSDLIAYSCGDLTDEAAQRVEEDYFACGACAARLAWVARLDAMVVSLVRAGMVNTPVTEAWLNRAAGQGVRLRPYSLSPGTTVACTAAPEDDFVVVRLHVPAAQGDSVRLKTESVLLESGQRESHQMEDVPFDARAGEVIVAYGGDLIRALPRSRWTVHATIQSGAEERTVGPYILDHTPWEQLPLGNS